MVKTNRKFLGRKSRKTQRKRVNNRRRGGMSGIAPMDETMDPKEAFEFFLDNSRKEFLMEGAYGMAIIATLIDGNKSPYKSTDAETYGIPVRKMIIKLMSITREGKEGEKQINDKDFNREVDIQKEIYFKTNKYLEPVCPAIVYSNIYNFIYNIKEKRKLFQKFDANANYHTAHVIDEKFTISDSIGIIGMEYANGYDTLFDIQERGYLEPQDKHIYKAMAMFLLLETALKTGYSHADFHTGNIMINTVSRTYFVQTNPSEPRIFGKPLLIDFGMTNKIPPEIMALIKESCDREEYTTALHYLCKVPRSDGELITEAPHSYGWVCGSVDPNMTTEQIKKEVIDRIKAKNPNKSNYVEKYDEVTREMADISNMRFEEGTNDMIKLLFKQRAKAIEQIRERLDENGQPKKVLSPEINTEKKSSPNKSIFTRIFQRNSKGVRSTKR